MLLEGILIFNPNSKVNGDEKGTRYSINKVFELLESNLHHNQLELQRSFPSEWKESLFEKQQGACDIFSQQILNISNSEIDHIIPFSHGGKITLNNVKLTHMHCNRSKGNTI